MVAEIVAMPLYRVTTGIEFCYGHRLLGHGGKCRYLHGHNGFLEFDMETKDLDELGMVVDFGKLHKKVKDWVDENIDHRMILAEGDPAIPNLMELGEPIYVLDDNPTAENLAKHIHTMLGAQGLALTEIRLWETAVHRAAYRSE